MHWGSGIFGCSTCFTHFYFFCTHFFAHFHHIYSFSRLIDMVIHFEGACYRTSYFPPHFLGPSSPWISVLGIGCSTPATMEYYQDGLRVVNRQCKMESISFAIPSSNSPPDCPPSPLPNTQSSSPPKASALSPCHKNWEGPPHGPLQSTLGRLILRVFPRGVPRGSSGGSIV